MCDFVNSEDKKAGSTRRSNKHLLRIGNGMRQGVIGTCSDSSEDIQSLLKGCIVFGTKLFDDWLDTHGLVVR